MFQHPSWAAKRKVQTIGEFQGKKIKFDDEGESKSLKPAAPRSVPPQVRTSTGSSIQWEYKYRMFKIWEYLNTVGI